MDKTKIETAISILAERLIQAQKKSSQLPLIIMIKHEMAILSCENIRNARFLQMKRLGGLYHRDGFDPSRCYLDGGSSKSVCHPLVA